MESLFVVLGAHPADCDGGTVSMSVDKISTYIGNCLALVEQLLGTAQLADDLLGVVAFAFHGASPGQVWPIAKLS
jgi:hypothetical protein